MARQRFELAMALLLPGSLMQQDLHLLQSLRRERTTLVQQLGQPPSPTLPRPRDSLVRSVQAKRETLRELLLAKPLAILRVSPLAKQRLLLLLVTSATQRDLFLHLAKLQERQRPRVTGSLVPRARGRRCSRCPDPCAFFQETPFVQKCNRVARCGGYPIFVRYR